MSGESGYQTVDVLGYNPTTKKLGLKVNGADTVIPFSGGVNPEDYGFSYQQTLQPTVTNGHTLFIVCYSYTSAGQNNPITFVSGGTLLVNYYQSFEINRQGYVTTVLHAFLIKATSNQLTFTSETNNYASCCYILDVTQ